MAESVNIGSLTGVLAMKAEYRAEMDRFEARLKAVEDKTVKFSKTTKSETDKINDAYKRVAAALDPVVANTQKYEKAEKALNDALKKSIITQDQYNKSLGQAKEKYLSANASTLTWREEIHKLSGNITNLTGALGPLGTGISTLTSHISASIASVKSLVATISGPAIAGFAALAASLVLVYGAFKLVGAGVEFLQNAIGEGLKTQLVIERLNNALAANGSASGLSSREMVAYAESLELVTARSKEEIVAAETILSRFDSLGKESFPRALDATLAYAKAMGTTADAAANKLGPAFEGNTRSLNALKEAGIVFSAGQRKTLTSMIEMGKITEYQALLFDILEEKVGTVAEGYDNNLTRQAGRARLVLEDFGESIANQVIPALEDVFSELIESAGGWEHLKETVNRIGGEIGDIIRTMVYGIMIAYHEWESGSDQLAATILGAFSRIAEGVANLAPLASVIPGMQGLAGVSDKAREASERLGNAALKAGMSAAGHEVAIVRLTQKLVQHRVALEGDSQAHKKLGSSIDEVASKNAKASREAQQINRIMEENAETIRYLMEQEALAAKGPGLDIATRLHEEQRINDEHEYRVSLLKLQSQFGKTIGEQLAKQEQAIKFLAREVKIKMQLSLDLAPIKMDASITKQFESSMKFFMEWFKDAEKVALANAEAFRAVGEAHDDWLEDFAGGWKESFKTVGEIIADEMESVKEAVSEGYMTVAEGERALATLRSELLMSHLDEWQGFFSTMGGLLGGVFQKISQAISNIQAAYKASSQLGSMASNAGLMSSGTGAALGYMGGTLAIMYELYKGVSAQIAKDKARKWSDVTTVQVKGGEFNSPSYFNEAGRSISFALERMVREIVDSLDAVLKDLPKIVIRSRKDGKEFSAYVAGVWVGTFKDAQQALEAGVSSAIQQADFASISKEYAIALKASLGSTMEELQANLDTARTARGARLGDTGSQYVEVADKWRQEIEAARELGLAVDDIIKARDRELAALKNSVLGIDTTISDQLAALSSLNKGIAEASSGMRASLQQQIDSILAQIKLLEGHKPSQPGGTGGGGAGGTSAGGSGGANQPYAMLSDADSEWQQAIAKLKAQLSQYIGELDKVPDALSDLEINMGIFDALFKPFEGNAKMQAKYGAEAHKFALMRVEIEYSLIKLKLIELNRWQEFASMFTDSLNAAREVAGQAGRGGGGKGSGEKQSARDFVKDRTFELSLVGLTGYQRSLKELDKQYADLIAQAGKDHKLKDSLLKLKEKELALLREEEGRRVGKSFKDFVAPSSDFDKIRETAQGLIEDISKSPFGDARKAGMIGRVLDALDKKLEDLAKQSAISLFGSLISDLQAFGVGEQELLGYRKAMAILEHTLKMEHYRAEIAILEAEGKLAPDVLKGLKDAFGLLSTFNPADLFGNSVDNAGESWYAAQAEAAQNYLQVAAEAAKAVTEATEMLNDYQSQGKSRLQRDLEKINEDFTKIIASLGETPAVIGAMNEAIERAYDEALSGVQDLYDSLLNGGSNSSSTIAQQFQLTQSGYDAIMAEVQSGDYTNMDRLGDMGQNLVDLFGQMYGTSTQAFQDFRSQELARLAKVLNIGSFNETPNNVLQFPREVMETSRANVDATNKVADVINIRGARQEALLLRLSDGLNGLVTVLNNQTESNYTSYGQ